MRIYDYMKGILGAMGVGEDVGVPEPSWRIEEYLKAIYDKLKEGGGNLPSVTEADNGKVMAVVDGEWEPSLIPFDDEKIEQSVDAWLDDHPEATTTVQDGSITNAKLATSFVTPGTATAYSSSATYAVGDYCFHNGSLYRCTTPITTAEAWTAAHWTAAVLGDDVGELKSALSQDESLIEDLNSAVYNPSKNIYKSSIVWENATFVDGVYTPKTTGRNDAAEAEYIPVSASENYVISWKAKDLTCRLYACGYNASYEPLNGYVINNATMNVVTRYATFTTPANCAYIRLRIYRSNDSDAWNTFVPEELQIEKGTEPTEYTPYEVTSKIAILEDSVEDMQEEIENNPAVTQRHEVASDKNLLDSLIVGYVKDDGSFSTMSSWRRSDYIPVTPGTYMYFYNISPYNFFYFYDQSKSPLGGKATYGVPVTLHNAMLVVFTVPANAAYMIVSLEDTKAETCWGNYTPTIPTGEIIYANTNTLRTYAEFPSNPCDYSGMDVCTFRKGICIGDSITGGGFNYSSGTNPWRDGNIYSYPSQFSKMTGVEMTNEGHSGLTSVQWWATYGTGGEHEVDFSGHDFAIIHLGINDVSYAVDIEDTETAYQNIIDALKAANEGIKIFVCTIIPAYADAENLTPYAAVNALVKSFASQENVYCCDLTTYGHEYTVSQYTAGHLTAYGYWRMAKDLIGYIGYIMQSIPDEFRFIQFIGTDMEYTPGQ